ncbi:MAG: cytochrome c biogenesis CcdA family protein [Propionibacteriaceae bacterium]|jgi:cytochrome c biogenesis protein CcdA|nr:cytochrome c biogenesis CcdA family protein [Propionibacteriaceae bacterium]
MEVTLAGAFIGGVLMLLSPCSALLLPAFFAYAFNSAGKLLARTAIFFLGLITTLVPMGLLAGTVGAFVNANRPVFVGILSALVVVFGLVLALGVRLPGVQANTRADGTSSFSVYLLGTVYGLGSVCAGPILGAVLAMAALGGNALFGALVLLVFALGMTVPLLVLSAFWSRLHKLQQWVMSKELVIGKWSNSWANVIAGLITVALGLLLFFTDGTANLPGIVNATTQFNLETSLLSATAGIPNWAFILVAAVLLAGGWGLRKVWKS